MSGVSAGRPYLWIIAALEPFPADAPQRMDRWGMHGFLVAAIPLDPLLDRLAEGLRNDGLRLAAGESVEPGRNAATPLRAFGGPGDGILADWIGPGWMPPALEARIEVLGWALTLRALPGVRAVRLWPLAVFGVGLFVSAALAGLIQRRGRILAAHARDIERLKRAKAALRHSNERFQQLAEVFPETIFEADLDGRVTYANDYGMRRFAMSAEDVAGGISVFDLVAPEERAVAMERMKQRLEGRLSGYLEYRARTKGGDCFHALAFSTPIMRDQRTVGIRGFVLDISERKQMELDLRTSQEYLRAVLDALHDAVFVHDAASGRIIDVNQRVCDLYGCSREEALQFSAGMFSAGVEPYTRERAVEWLRQARETGPQTFEWLSRNRLGQPFRLEMSVRFSLIGGQERFIVTGHDITSRRRLEEALRDKDALYRTLFETANDGIFILDPVKILDCNERGAAMCGLVQAELIGTASDRLFPSVHQSDWPAASAPESGHAGDPVGAALRGQPQVFERRLPRPDGGIADVEVTLNRIEIGDAVYLQAIVRDIRERKQADALARQALEDAEQLARSRSDFLANMSHEIRTPLNAVLGLAQLGQRESSGRKAEETFTRILSAGQHVLGVVNDILDFSKIEADKLELELAPMAIGATIDRALGMVAGRAYAKGLDLRVVEAADLPESARGDALRLSQILVNLLANAVKFTDRGRVTLTVRVVADSLVFEVEDSGIGMTPEQVGRLFMPFEQADSSTTRRFGGSGLGLAISKRLADLMDGTIEADSRLGEGSRFRVCIPLAGAVPAAEVARGEIALVGLSDREADWATSDLAERGVQTIRLPADADWPAVERILLTPQALTAARLAAAKAAGQALAVLITPGVQGSLAAEDNEINRLVLEEILVSEGAGFHCLENGRLLLEHLEQAGDADYAILLTDIQMPEVNGYQTARRCRERYPSLPVVGLTAHAMPEERGHCLAVGMVEHLAKPLDIDRLVAVILQYARVPNASEARPPLPPEVVPAATDMRVDWAGLNARYAGQPEFLARLIGLALQNYPETPGRLRAAAAAGDVGGVATLAHDIKGMSGSFMSWALHEQAREAERAAREGEPDVLALAERLALAVEQWLAELAARESTSASPQDGRASAAGRASPRQIA